MCHHNCWNGSRKSLNPPGRGCQIRMPSEHQARLAARERQSLPSYVREEGEFPAAKPSEADRTTGRSQVMLARRIIEAQNFQLPAAFVSNCAKCSGRLPSRFLDTSCPK